MSGIADDVRSIVGELDADGGGYRTGEAAGLLVHRYVLAGICDADGAPKPKVRSLMRMGAGMAFKGYKPAHKKNNRRREAAAAAVGGVQRDFVELADDFEFAWLMNYAAFDEGDEAERKVLVRMTRPEVLAVIALKRKKASEAAAEADRLQDIVDRNPDWANNPDLTVADILDIQDIGD